MSEVLKFTKSRERLFRGQAPDIAIPDVEVGRQLRTVPVVSVPTHVPVDLTGRPKIIMVMGAGGSGKSTWLRAVAEWALARDADSTAIFAAVGDRRDLALYFPVAQPESFDPAQETRWLEALISHCMTNKLSAAIDFDGGDVTVASLVAQQDDLAAMVEASGVSLVAVYMLTPRITDLTTLASLERSGFQPAATMLVLNEGASDTATPFDIAFGPIQRHGAFVAAAARGAVVIRMPRLHAAAAVEQRRILFGQARDAVSPEGQDVPQMNAFDRGRVGRWMTEMEEAFEPVKGWLP